MNDKPKRLAAARSGQANGTQGGEARVPHLAALSMLDPIAGHDAELATGHVANYRLISTLREKLKKEQK